jgi:hypothetical protein
MNIPSCDTLVAKPNDETQSPRISDGEAMIEREGPDAAQSHCYVREGYR